MFTAIDCDLEFIADPALRRARARMLRRYGAATRARIVAEWRREVEVEKSLLAFAGPLFADDRPEGVR